MRYYFNNLDWPNSATKYLARLSSELSLQRARDVFAASTGYRDWHELKHVAESGKFEQSQFDQYDAKQLILSLAETLSLDDGDVQFALAKSRVLGGQPWPLQDQIQLRLSLVRDRYFGRPGRRKPGTVIRVRGEKDRPAFLLQSGRPTGLLYDSGFGGCADFEVVTPRQQLEDFLPSRFWLPYGYWTLRDRSRVVFARDYLPLWHITESATVRLDPWLWINGIAEEAHFISASVPIWSNGAARESALAYLKHHRIFELPRLANALRYVIEPEVDSVHDAVKLLYRNSQSNLREPPFAVVRTSLIGH